MSYPVDADVRRLAFQLFHGWNARRAALLVRLRRHLSLSRRVAYRNLEALKGFAWLREVLRAEKAGRPPRWTTFEEWNIWTKEMAERGRLEMERTQRRIAFVEGMVNPHPNPNRVS